ncbi:MAG: Ig-like domain-containing protein, partial [Bacteroidales bacterium]|nr:Ig-like domain-containing protein [Bacteroidales bacterium]
SDNTVATVNSAGTATARARGTATIIASYTVDGESYAAAAVLTVAQQIVEVHRLEITPAETTISEGASLTYQTRLFTDIYTDGILSHRDTSGAVLANTDVLWSITSGSSCATVNAAGVVTGVSLGDVTVKATYKNDTSVTTTALLHIDNVYNVDPGTGGTGSGGGNY